MPTYMYCLLGRGRAFVFIGDILLLIKYITVDSFLTACPWWKKFSGEVLSDRFIFLWKLNWDCDSKASQTLCVIKLWQRQIIRLWHREACIYKRQDLSFVYSLVNQWSMSWYFSIDLAYFIFPSNLRASGKQRLTKLTYDLETVHKKKLEGKWFLSSTDNGQHSGVAMWYFKLQVPQES